MSLLARVLISLLTLSACLSLQGTISAQSRETSTTLNSPTQVERKTPEPDLIEDVCFNGLNAVTKSDVIKAFREQRAGLLKDAPFLHSNVQKGANIVKQVLADAGFMNAIVDVRVEDVSARAKRITFVVDEGPPAVVREIQFEGNQVFTDDELRSRLQLVTEMSHDVYDRATLDYDLYHVRNFMRSRGYLKARILEPKLQSLNGNVTITLPVEESRLYRIGEITVVGSERLSPEQIIELIGLKNGNIADGRRLSEFLFEELKSLYMNMGYLQYSAELDLELRDNPNVENEGIADFQISIDEGICFKIGSVEFAGNKKFTDKDLRRFLLFKEGDTYNQQLINDSVRNLNESGLLEPMEVESDVNFKTDEDAGLISIVIKVQEYED